MLETGAPMALLNDPAVQSRGLRRRVWDHVSAGCSLPLHEPRDTYWCSSSRQTEPGRCQWGRLRKATNAAGAAVSSPYSPSRESAEIRLQLQNAAEVAPTAVLNEPGLHSVVPRKQAKCQRCKNSPAAIQLRSYAGTTTGRSASCRCQPRTLKDCSAQAQGNYVCQPDRADAAEAM